MDVLILKTYFSSAHFYKKSDWSIDENLKHFGKCFGDFGHGHNYILEVSFETDFKKLTLTDTQNLKKKLQALTDVLDHKHLNHEIDFFKDKIPTTEMICLYFQEQLKHFEGAQIKKIRVFENTDLWSELHF